MPFIKDRSIWVGRRYHTYHEVFQIPTGHKFYSDSWKMTRNRTGNANPHWKEQVRNQTNATTQMSGTYDTFRSDLGRCWSFTRTSDPQDKTIYSNYADGDLLSKVISKNINWSNTLSNAKAYNTALVQFLKKVRREQTVFSGPTFLGELRESMRMIRRPAQGLRNLCDSYLDRVKKVKKQRPKNWKKNLSDMWLEQAFGWTPLINDINDSYKAYKSLADARTQVPVTAYGVDGELAANQSASGTVDVHSIIGYKYGLRCTNNQFVRIRGMVTRQVEQTFSGKLQPFGFTPEEFIPTAWELLPWSFLVDYFSNIGDVITANVASRSNLAWTNVSTVGYQIAEVSAGPDLAFSVGGIPLKRGGDSLTSKRERRVVTRDTVHSLGQPTFYLELPGRPAQWANMLALFASANAGIHPQRFTRYRA